jgi:hypothetical protein
MANSFIHYDTKKGISYASVYTPAYRNGRKVNDIEYLGRVIDSTQNLYRNQKRGIFRYSLEDGYSDGPPSVPEKLILDFGPSFVFHEIMQRIAFIALLRSVFGQLADSVLALVAYKVTEHRANCYAADWFDGAYARLLYLRPSFPRKESASYSSSLGKRPCCGIFSGRISRGFRL